MASFLDSVSDTQLRQVCELLHSIDPDVHAQGLELLATLAPAGPGAKRGVLVAELPHGDNYGGLDMCGARFRSRRGYWGRAPDLRGACLVGSAFFSGSLPYSDLRDTDLRYSRLHVSYGADRIQWYRPKLAGADLRGAILGPLDLRGVDLLAASWAGVDWRGADLRGADLRGGRFSGVDFSGVNFSGAQLKGANLKGARLAGADLTGADLYRANLKGADLTGAALVFDDTIRWDANTRWPAGQAPAPGSRPSRLKRRYHKAGT